MHDAGSHTSSSDKSSHSSTSTHTSHSTHASHSPPRYGMTISSARIARPTLAGPAPGSAQAPDLVSLAIIILVLGLITFVIR
jgi:hypothetical protein